MATISKIATVAPSVVAKNAITDLRTKIAEFLH
jgi:hypothetical protein